MLSFFFILGFFLLKFRVMVKWGDVEEVYASAFSFLKKIAFGKFGAFLFSFWCLILGLSCLVDKLMEGKRGNRGGFPFFFFKSGIVWGWGNLCISV